VKKKIFLAEDDEDDALFFTQAVSELSLDISLTILCNGDKLIKQLEKHDVLPDIIFLDLNMPLKDGLECLREIKTHSLWKAIKIIMLSTTSDKAQIAKCYSLGADIFVTKAPNFNIFKLNLEACLL